MTASLLTAFALMFLIEGLLPFAAPAAWREVFRKAVELEDGQIRLMGLGSISIGLVLLMFFGD